MAISLNFLNQHLITQLRASFGILSLKTFPTFSPTSLPLPIMIFPQLSAILRPPRDTPVAYPTSSLSRALFSEPVTAHSVYISNLDYLANVSLRDFLALYWNFFFQAPSARSCHVRAGILQLLVNLLGVLRTAFLLLFQRTFFTAFLLVFQHISGSAATQVNQQLPFCAPLQPRLSLGPCLTNYKGDGHDHR